MYNTVSELYDDLLGIYFDEYNDLKVAKWKKINSEYDPIYLFPEPYQHINTIKSPKMFATT